ncbi:MAG: hypothetical protein LUG99_19150 [Lachnospiraceae bacterium]|nr:hypothetical protein [Lachnospiraceae bacterium]
MNNVLLGVPNVLPERGKKYELHRLLGALFSNQLTSNERIDILENEYRIAAGTEFREEMKVMFNLSEGIFEQGIAEGEARGEARGELKKAKETAFNLRSMGYDDSQISMAVNVGIDVVKSWFADMKAPVSAE